MNRIYVITELTNDYELNVSRGYTSFAAAQAHFQNAIKHEKEIGMLAHISPEKWKIKELPRVFDARDQHSERFLEITLHELDVRDQHFSQEKDKLMEESPQAKADRLREIYDEKVRQLKEFDTSIDEASRRNLLDRYKRFFEAKETAMVELAKLGSQRNAPRKAKSKIQREIKSLQLQIEEVEILIEKKEQIFQEFVKAKIDLLQHKVAVYEAVEQQRT